MDLLFKVRSGSFLYGLHTFESCVEYESVRFPDKGELLGLNKGKCLVDSWLTKDPEIKAVELRSFLTMALKGMPNAIEIFFANEDSIIEMNEGEIFFSNVDWFLSKNIHDRILEQVSLMRTRMTRHGMFLVCRNKAYVNYRDNLLGLLCSDSLRLLNELYQLHTEKRITYPLLDPMIMESKLGNVDRYTVLRRISELERKVVSVLDKSKLPDKPNFDKVNEACIKLIIDNVVG